MDVSSPHKTAPTEGSKTNDLREKGSSVLSAGSCKRMRHYRWSVRDSDEAHRSTHILDAFFAQLLFYTRLPNDIYLLILW